MANGAMNFSTFSSSSAFTIKYKVCWPSITPWDWTFTPYVSAFCGARCRRSIGPIWGSPAGQASAGCW